MKHVKVHVAEYKSALLVPANRVRWSSGFNITHFIFFSSGRRNDDHDQDRKEAEISISVSGEHFTIFRMVHFRAVNRFFSFFLLYYHVISYHSGPSIILKQDHLSLHSISSAGDYLNFL